MEAIQETSRSRKKAGIVSNISVELTEDGSTIFSETLIPA
jgi:hypothetical protein